MSLSLTQFADQISQVMPVIMKAFSRCQSQQLQKDKITLVQALVLTFLGIEGESKMTDLATFMGVTTPAMTGIVDRLVKSGFCLRNYDSHDRRIIKITLTAKGDEQVKRIKEYRRQMIIKTFTGIAEDDRQAYLRILLQIKEILSNNK